MRLLVVDDEPLVLQGLQRTLRSMSKEWSMEFACGGKEALSQLAAAPFDVILTDARMPEIDGAQLLREVQRLHPETIRMVLSGQSSRRALFEFIGICHQYLSKPCDIEDLKAKINNAVRLRELLTNPAVKSAVSGISCVPSLPALYQEITQELQNSEPSLSRVGGIIAKDAGMTVKILQLTNSALLGIRFPVSDPLQAVSLLGLEMIRALVISIHIFAPFEKVQLDELDMGQLWRHMLATGKLARAIAQAEHAPKQALDDSFTAGLLHCLGKLALASTMPEIYREILREAKAGKPLVEAERQRLECSHSEVGAYLVGIWGLPNPIVEAIAWYHTPAASGSKSFTPLVAVYAAHCLLGTGPLAHFQDAAPVDEDYLRSVGLAGRQTVWRELCEEVVEAMQAEVKNGHE
jgi:HD-like signal output (HDOD) protein